ncbi:MAG: acyl-CoA dehydrogenase [Dehalococcoidia bacterium]|nr:MAG: acyl-CoA dehydrogenase [Dehalococcoidia bacterium]
MAATEPLDIDLLRRSAREFFAHEYPPPRIRAMDEAQELDPQLWRDIAALGWLGLSIPQEYGGAGASTVAAAVLMEEIARAFASLAVDYALGGMIARLLSDVGTPEQRVRWLTGFAAGEEILSFGISEPSGGTDALALTTRARLNGDHWVVTGQKLWTSMAHKASAIITVARTDDPDPPDRRARGISLIIVPTGQPGLSISRVHLAGMRAAGTCLCYFDGATAPANHLLGPRGRGFHAMLGMLNVERVLAGAISVGIARGALEDAVAYAKDRHAFGRPIGAFQAIQHPLAETAAELEAARLLVHHVAERIDAGEQPTKEAAMAKLFAAEVAIRATDRGMRTMAAHGLAAESDMQRYFRDARLQVFSPVSNEMAKNIVGEALGMPRSY